MVFPFVCGLMLSLLPAKVLRPASETFYNRRGEVIKTPRVTWWNFLAYPEFYESAATAWPPGMLIAFAPFLLALQVRLVPPFRGWAMGAALEGLVFIAGSGALFITLAFKHANFMTGYTEWKDTPVLFVLPAYGILTGIACLVVPWIASLRELSVRLLAR